MYTYCRLIHSFTNGSRVDALWRLCASSRLANRRSVFHNITASPVSLSTFSGKCQPFQEKVHFEKKHCQPFQEIFPKSVNQNQEKTAVRCSVAALQLKIQASPKSKLNFIFIYI